MLKISDEIIELRSVEKSDLSASFVAWLNDKEVVRYSQQRHVTHTIETSINYLTSFQNSKNLYLIVSLRPENIPIGSVTAYFSNDGKKADIGILIGKKEAWGKGYGLKAWCLLMNFLFQERSVNAVTGGCDFRNKGMISIFKKAGMIKLCSEQCDDVTTIRYIKYSKSL